MPITNELLLKLSIKTGTAGHSQDQADPNASLGKYISTTLAVGTTLFDDVTGDENSANGSGAGVEYRCVFVHNSHATLAAINPVVWIDSQVAGGANIAIGVDPAPQSAIGAAPAQAQESANVNTAPAGVSFTTPASKGAGLSLGATLDPGYCRAIWIRRSTTNSGAKKNDGGIIAIECDTEE